MRFNRPAFIVTIALLLLASLSCNVAEDTPAPEPSPKPPEIQIFPEGAVLQPNAQQTFTTSVTNSTLTWATTSLKGASIDSGVLTAPTEPETFSLFASYSTSPEVMSAVEVEVVPYWMRAIAPASIDATISLSRYNDSIVLTGRQHTDVEGRRYVHGWIALLDPQGRTLAEYDLGANTLIFGGHNEWFVGWEGGGMVPGWPVLGHVDTVSLEPTVQRVELVGTTGGAALSLVASETKKVVLGTIGESSYFTFDIHENGPGAAAILRDISPYQFLTSCQGSLPSQGAFIFYANNSVAILRVGADGSLTQLESSDLGNLQIASCAYLGEVLVLGGGLNGYGASVRVDMEKPELSVFRSDLQGVLATGASSEDGKKATFAGLADLGAEYSSGFLLEVTALSPAFASLTGFHHSYGHVLGLDILDSVEDGAYIDLEFQYGAGGLAFLTEGFKTDALAMQPEPISFTEAGSIAASWVAPSTISYDLSFSPLAMEMFHSINDLIVPPAPQ